jgi:bromodomain-containing factor 1
MLFKDPRVLPFERPVDPEEFGLKDYFKIIKKPMDLGTVDRKLRKGEYDKENLDTEFYADVSLVFGNAMKYNTKGDPVHELAGAVFSCLFLHSCLQYHDLPARCDI